MDNYSAYYGRYDDEQLKKEFTIFKTLFDIEDIEETMIMSHIDDAYMPLLETIAQRFLDTPGKNIIYLDSK